MSFPFDSHIRLITNMDQESGLIGS